MEKICAWCGTFMLSGAAATSDPSHAAISHAICVACFDELESALARNGLRRAAGSASPLPARARSPDLQMGL